MFLISCVNAIISTSVGNTTNSWQYMEESHIKEYHEAKEKAKQTNESES